MILQAESFRPNKVAYITTSIVRKEKMFVHVLNTLVNYVRAFSLQYNAWFVEAQINDSFENIMAPGSFARGMTRRTLVTSCS